MPSTSNQPICFQTNAKADCLQFYLRPSNSTVHVIGKLFGGIGSGSGGDGGCGSDGIDGDGGDGDGGVIYGSGERWLDG